MEHFKLIQSKEQPQEWESTMAHAALLLASEPLDKTTGRVTYSQEILKEFAWPAMEGGKNAGCDTQATSPPQLGSQGFL